MAENTHRQVTITRRSAGQYRATNTRGASIDFGSGRDEQFTPVELLLAALGSCASVGVDVVTSRRSEPREFAVTVSAEKLSDDDGGTQLEQVVADFAVAFDDDEAGRIAASLVEKLIRRAHQLDCTVSRTIERPTPVTFRVNGSELS